MSGAVSLAAVDPIQLIEDLKNKNEELELLAQEFEMIRKDNKQLRSVVENAERESKQYNAELAELRSQNASLQQQINELKPNEALERTIKELLRERDAERERVAAKDQQMHDERKKWEDKAAGLERELALAHDELAQSLRLQQALEELEGEEAKELSKLRSAMLDYEELKIRSQQQSMELSQLKSVKEELAKALGKIDELSQQLDTIERLKRTTDRVLGGGGDTTCRRRPGPNAPDLIFTDEPPDSITAPHDPTECRKREQALLGEIDQLRNTVNDLLLRKKRIEAMKPQLKMQFEKHAQEITRLGTELNNALQLNLELQQQLQSRLETPQDKPTPRGSIWT